MLMLMSCFLITSILAQDKAACPDKEKSFEIEVKDVEGFYMVYYEFKGPYEEAFDEFMSLIEYLANNEIEMGPNALGIFYDDPEVVAPEDLRSEVGFMVTGEVPSNEKYKYKKIENFKAVATKYYSLEDIKDAYQAVGEYLQENELVPGEYSFEIYYSEDPVKVDTEILMPIK